jgi:hypothetical protein
MKEPREGYAIFFKGYITELGLWFENLTSEQQKEIYDAYQHYGRREGCSDD